MRGSSDVWKEGIRMLVKFVDRRHLFSRHAAGSLSLLTGTELNRFHTGQMELPKNGVCLCVCLSDANGYGTRALP